MASGRELVTEPMANKPLLITNATLVTWGDENRILPGHALRVVDDRIGGLGPDAEMRARYPEDKTLDAGAQLLMPGNICAHTHFYGAFARGMAIPGDSPKDFPDILERLWWKLDKALSVEDVRASAEIFMVDAIRNGTTTLIDHHASPNAIAGSLDAIADVVETAGLRACLCYEVSDRDGPDKLKAGIDENVRFIRKVRSERPARLAATFGLHASLSLSDASLEACRAALPEGGGFHIHVAEHESDEYDSLKRSGTRVVDRLQRHGILGPRSIAAHCVHADAREAEILAETGTWVTHQPRSNMNNAVGAADIEGLTRLGIKVCLGTDGFSHAMWDEWKAAYFLHKAAHRDPRRANGSLITEMGVTNNAALAGMFFPNARLGALEAGAHADLILVDYHAPTPLSAGNLPWHILFGFGAQMVTMTMCAGRILMQDRRIVDLDEKEIAARARELAVKAWARYRA